MKVLSYCESVSKSGYGCVGTPTNMYDSDGNQLFVGDVVLTSYNGNQCGIEFVCDESPRRTYVMGIADIWNNRIFEYKKWHDPPIERDGWQVYKVKGHELLVVGERVGNIRVDEVEESEGQQ